MRLVETYLARAATQLANLLLSCPEPNHAAMAGEVSYTLLRGAALYARLRDIADANDHGRRLK